MFGFRWADRGFGARRIELMRDEVDLGVDTVTEKAGNRKREVELHLKFEI